MRYWYNSDNLSWTSNDGYVIQLNQDIKGYKLFSPNGFLLGIWYCDDLRKQIGDLDIKLYEYMFYKAERFLTVIGIKIEESMSELRYYDLNDLQDTECTVKFKERKKQILNSIYGICASRDNTRTCGNCKHLIFKRYDEKRGYCRLVRIHRNFSDPCVHEEEMT